MGAGDFLSNLFFGPGEQETPAGVKNAQDEIMRLYQQAYNVKPVWNGKAWVMPQGAMQRYQMLLPILQAQASAAAKGQGANAAGANSGGVLGGLAGKAVSGLGEEAWRKLGGGSGSAGIVGKLWDLLSGGNPSDGTQYGPQGSAQSPYDVPPEQEAPVSVAPASMQPNILEGEGQQYIGKAGGTDNPFYQGEASTPDDWQKYLDSFSTPAESGMDIPMDFGGEWAL